MDTPNSHVAAVNSDAVGVATPGQKPLHIAGVDVQAGERTDLFLTISESYTGDDLRIPVTVINGVRRGPTVSITAAIHGDELNGVAIARELLSLIEPADLAGALIVVPVVNVLGLPLKSRYLPDRRDLNRSFPGNPLGSMASRLAGVVTREILDQVDAGIDLHTAAIGRANVPQTRGDMSDPRVLEMARAFAAPILIDAAIRPGSLRDAAGRSDVPMVLFEAGEALRFEDHVIEAGLHGTLRVLEHLDMVQSAPAAEHPSFESSETHWVRAERGGFATVHVALGDHVHEGDPLWTISSPFGGDRNVVTAPWMGMIIGLSTIPVVNPGDAIVHIGMHDDEEHHGRFDDAGDIEGDDVARW